MTGGIPIRRWGNGPREEKRCAQRHTAKVVNLGLHPQLLAPGVPAANVLALAVVQSAGCSPREACKRPDWRSRGGRLRGKGWTGWTSTVRVYLEDTDEGRGTFVPGLRNRKSIKKGCWYKHLGEQSSNISKAEGGVSLYLANSWV